MKQKFDDMPVGTLFKTPMGTHMVKTSSMGRWVGFYNALEVDVKGSCYCEAQREYEVVMQPREETVPQVPIKREAEVVPLPFSCIEGGK